MRKSSPYLTDPFRLADVIAAIQILGSYTWASCELDSWAKKLSNPSRPTDWRKVFIEHPEFFRVSEPDKNTQKEWVSLRWRHGYDRVYDVEERKELSISELEKLSESEWNTRLTRKQLTSGEIETLIKTAIELHGRAIAFAEEKRWLINILFTLAGIVIGALLGGLLK